ncbi:MAG: AI-2E family transporter [Oscillospiraceae bacterium]|nr:AI-2E family transporter [Oscillospiraceae bacterium]
MQETNESTNSDLNSDFNLTPDSGSESWKQQATKSLWMFLTIAAVILFYYLIQYLGSISSFIAMVLTGISPVIWGLALAYLLEPIANFWERNLRAWRMPKSSDPEKTAKRVHVASAILMVITAFVFIALLLLLIVPEISKSISGVAKTLPSQMENFFVRLRDRSFFDNSTTIGAFANNTLLTAFHSTEKWLSELPFQAQKLINYFYTGVKSVFNVVYNLVIGMILSMYITIDKEKLFRQIRKITYSVFPVETASKMRRMLRRGNHKFSAAIRGKVVDSMIIGVICFVLLSILNLLPWFAFPYPVLLAVVVGVTNVVPFFGPVVGGFITGVLVLFDNPRMVIAYVILIVVLQQFDANYLDPHMVGGSIGLKPFWSISSVLLGSTILGVPGFIIGPPVVAFIYEIVSEWTDDRLRAKHLETEFNIPPEEELEVFLEVDDPYGIQKQNEIEKKFKAFLEKLGNRITGKAKKSGNSENFRNPESRKIKIKKK